MKYRCLKNGFILFLILTAFYSHTLAQEVVTLDIPEMITLAISNNLDFQKAVYQLKNVEYDAQQLEAENLLTQSGILAKQKEMNLLQQQNTFQNQKAQLIIQLVDNYFKLILVEKDTLRKEKSVELEKAILAEVEAQVAAGYSVDVALLQQGNAYYNARFSYEKAKLDYQQLQLEVKNSLGIKPETDILVETVQMPQLPEIELNASLAKARENSVNLKSKSIAVELAYARWEKANISQEPQLEIAKQENNLKIAQLEKSIIEQELDFQIQTQWQNLRQNKNDILLNEQSLKQMQENESTIKRQVEAGLRTKDELLSATIGVMDAEYRLISSFRQCYQSYLELQRMMGILDEGGIK